MNELYPAIEAILFAAGEPISAKRLALILDSSEDEIFSAAERMAEKYIAEKRGIRLLRLDKALQLCSAPEYSDLALRAIDQRSPSKLSQASMEVLAIVAYFQPVTRAYVEQIRGVDSAYTVGVLAERGLIEPCGRLDVPGRPTIYKTGEAFLRVMCITNLSELPELPEIKSGEGISLLQEASLEDPE